MVIKIYQIGAIADRLFRGNPAPACPLEELRSAVFIQKIAMQNNLVEISGQPVTCMAGQIECN